MYHGRCESFGEELRLVSTRISIIGGDGSKSLGKRGQFRRGLAAAPGATIKCSK